MIYRQRNKKNYVGLKVIAGLVVLLILFRIFDINVMGAAVNSSFDYVLESKSAALSPIRNSIVYLQDKKQLEESRKALLSENTDLKLKALTTQAMTSEFEYFNSQFGQFTPDTRAIKVVLRPPFVPFDTLRISGDLEGYGSGDHVFFENVVIGTIANASGRSATVELFSSPGRVTPAVIRGVQFEAKGQGGGRFVIEVAKDFEISEGEPIIHPHEQFMLLGVVSQIESVEENLFKKIYFNTPVPLDSISYVTLQQQQPYEQTEPDN